MLPKKLDCIVAGSCVVDLLCRPITLNKPIGEGTLCHVDPLQLVGGGITCNAGIAMARMGMDVGILTYVGNDEWAAVIRNLFEREKINSQLILTHPTEATSTTVVTIDPSGERSFLHCVGAPKKMNKQLVIEHLDQLATAKIFLLGYYSLMPNLEPQLPEIFAMLRQRGVKTAMDAAGDGGNMQPLDRILPELDIYVPSLAEAEYQTGESDPQKIIKAYRACGAPNIVGVKLGMDGLLLSEKVDDYIHIPICPASGQVLDTTGAGDSCYAGLLTGLLKGLSLKDAGRLAVAAGANAVTSMGGCTGGQTYPQTAKLAGL